MTKPMAAVAGLMLLEQGRSPLQAKLADYYPGFADMKVGVPQADGSLKLGAQFSPIYIHDLYLVRFAPHERSYNVWQAEAAPAKMLGSTNKSACCAASAECGVKSNTTEKSVPAMGDG